MRLVHKTTRPSVLAGGGSVIWLWSCGQSKKDSSSYMLMGPIDYWKCVCEEYFHPSCCAIGASILDSSLNVNTAISHPENGWRTYLSDSLCRYCLIQPSLVKNDMADIVRTFFLAGVAASVSPSFVIEELDSSGTELETGPLYLYIEGQAKCLRSQAKTLLQKLFWIKSRAQTIGWAKPLRSVAWWVATSTLAWKMLPYPLTS